MKTNDMNKRLQIYFTIRNNNQSIITNLQFINLARSNCEVRRAKGIGVTGNPTNHGTANDFFME